MALLPFASLGRLRQITSVVARHGLGHYFERRRARAKGKEAPAPEEGIPAAARRFRAILEDLGPTFIKFGQVLSTRADVLPPGFAEALTGLQDDCPAMPAADVEKAVKTGLGRSLKDAFRDFDPAPVASASIAQVHRAVTHEGDEVAVKIQRPGIRTKITRDLDLLRYLAELVEAIVEESGLVTPRGVVDEFESALLGELDFQHEAAMMKRFLANNEGKNRPYVVPKVYDALSGRTVLTMQFIRGSRLHQLGPQHDKKKIAQNIVAASFEQLFADGLFHADPHPGNVFILDDNRLALLDFGCVGQISYAMRETLVVMVLSVGMRDADSVARLLYRVGIPDKRVSLQRLRDAVAGVFDHYLRDQTKLANIEASQLLRDLFDLAARFQVRIPSEYALVGRAAVAVEGAIRMLDPDLDVLSTAGDYIKRLVDEQFKMPEGESALKGLLQARGLLRDLPVMVSQILLDLESGKLQVQVESPKFDAIARNIETAGITVFMGLVAGGLVTGSFFVLARYDFELWGLPVWPIVGLYLASILFGTAVGRYLLAPRLRKLSLSRLLGRRRKWS